MMVDLSCANWRKSTRSGNNGCVEVAWVDGKVAVHDSKDRGGPVLVFDPHEWAAFTAATRDGEFELSRLAQGLATRSRTGTAVDRSAAIRYRIGMIAVSASISMSSWSSSHVDGLVDSSAGGHP